MGQSDIVWRSVDQPWAVHCLTHIPHLHKRDCFSEVHAVPRGLYGDQSACGTFFLACTRCVPIAVCRCMQGTQHTSTLPLLSTRANVVALPGHHCTSDTSLKPVWKVNSATSCHRHRASGRISCSGQLSASHCQIVADGLNNDIAPNTNLFPTPEPSCTVC